MHSRKSRERSLLHSTQLSQQQILLGESCKTGPASFACTVWPSLGQLFILVEVKGMEREQLTSAYRNCLSESIAHKVLGLRKQGLALLQIFHICSGWISNDGEHSG
ncbi:hypothetical protein Y1Q_0017545 [Alligator mississippiensis]|uniref:Uncharacterized protein n=1 Tax=Alligator mississippiensis TaxID=8496 RepID=A0A151P2T2_ALLMI|nr:hypothetical protein Y1Q_0017545 [Alligator mississippiensis]